VYKKLIVALDESQEATRALTTAIDLAKQLGSGLRIITVSEPLPAYAGFIDAEIPGARQRLLEERNAYYSELQRKAVEQAAATGIKAECIVLEGDEVQTIADHIVTCGADLLVIGRRHHSTMTRLWGGTVHNIAERVRCSILAVY
jgi:nucleotide-binding universal stress UspA family protein